MTFLRRPVVWLALICTAAFAVFFYPMIVEGKLYTYRDALAGVLPLRHFWLESVQSLQLPVWNPHLHGGKPFFADFKNAVLSPFNLPFLFFNSKQIAYAYSWFLLFHFPFMFIGMRWFLRNQGIARQASIVFALVYCFSGAVVSAFSMPGLMAAQTIMPFFAVFVLRWRQGTLNYLSGNTLGLLVCLALPVYSVLPEISFYFALFFLACLASRFSMQRLQNFALIGASALLATAPVSLAGIDYMLGAAGAEVTNHYIKYPMAPGRLLEFFLLNPFGDHTSKSEYFGRYLSSAGRFPLFFSVYLGSASLLGFVALSFRPWRRQRLLIALLGLIALAMFAHSVPYLGKHLYYALSLGYKFRSPEKLVVFFSFVSVFCMASGWQRLFALIRSRQKWLKLVLIWFAVLFSLFALTEVFVHANGKSVALSVWQYFLILAYAQVVVLMLCLKSEALLRMRWLMLLPLLVFDMGKHANKNTWLQPNTVLPSHSADLIQKNMQTRSGELKQGGAFRILSRRGRAGDFDYDFKKELFDSLDIVGRMSVFVTNSLVSNTVMLHGLSAGNGAGVIRTKAQASLWREMYVAMSERIMNLAGVYYNIFTPLQLSATSRLEINKNALPFAFVPRQIIASSDLADMQGRIMLSDFDEQTQAVVQMPGKHTFANRKIAVRNVKRNLPHQLSIEIDSMQGQELGRYLLINESYDRHWRASIDGTSLALTRANFWSMAVQLPEACQNGCQVDLRYENELIRAGFLIGFLYLLVHVALFTRKKVRLKKATA